ncbi:MAG TPA: Hsp20/alpha crystallin family protein [Gammaproteobacteria bacterium]|nr:Hsp20/alpha crystallin family protein [Gammaproteobacteria bacterium]
MRKRSLTPWRGLLGARHGEREAEHPLDVFHREIDRVFDNLWRDVEWPMLGHRESLFGPMAPRMDVTEDEDRVRVAVELPGMDEKDVEVVLSDNVLTIKVEKEESEKAHTYMERAYGSFYRTLPLDVEIVTDKVEATFDKGVLTIDLPKTPEAKKAYRKVPVRTVGVVKKLEKAA